ncbi:MAG: GTP 3',8-cyclase MoaA [Clostridiaceae bacterium]
MIDSKGRIIDYLRISITDRCNLRCAYCMPKEGIIPISGKDLLSFEEIIRICQVMAEDGLKKVKITGGEPLVRKDAVALIREIKKIDGIEKVTLTTNGVYLENQMKALFEAGIDGINISLDTLDEKLYAEITGQDQMDKVMRGLREALLYPEVQLKVNCVPLGLDRQNLVEIAELAKTRKIHVRFIEMMPVGLGKKYKGVKEETVKEELEKKYPKLTSFEKSLGNGPSHYYSIEGFLGKIGFISAISHKFCNSCNRMRLTSTGYLKTCLQFDSGKDLKQMMRNGCSDEELKALILEAVAEKPDEHLFLEKTIIHEDILCMSQIGG